MNTMEQGRQTDTGHAADRLVTAVTGIGAPVCVGLDPVLERLPAALKEDGRDRATAAQALHAFSLGVLDAVAGEVPCVKIQSACYERYGHAGVRVLEEVLAGAHQRDFAVILDAKRGDIGISADHYAAAAFGDSANGAGVSGGADWITINSYLGADGIRPFMVTGRGAFALVRTSNPGGDALQSRQLQDGRTVAESVAELVASIGGESVGACGYSSLGAVVGATKPEDANRLRQLMPQQIFLVPGFGAQGGGVQDVLPCFHEGGLGALVTASRSIIYAFDVRAGDWQGMVHDAARRFADEIGHAAGLR